MPARPVSLRPQSGVPDRPIVGSLPAVEYRIRPANPGAHLFEVTCTVHEPDPQGQVFSLPAWIPGSYMIREFARNIVSLSAQADGEPCGLEKLDKHTWRAAVAPGTRTLTLHYEVYAWDLSVRSAHLDTTHGFFNGTSVFVAVAGRTDKPCIVTIDKPEAEACRHWKLITALPPEHGRAGDAHRFGRFRAADYDELIDHPVEMGEFTLARFEAAGVPHDIALTGRHDCDLDRLCADLKRVCEWQIRLFGKPAPVDYYAFLTMVVGDGYGGLEHRASTALICSRADLPWKGMEGLPGGLPEGYRTFLGLCSHEYFHTWNVKRIKPAAFAPYDLGRENHTRLLWAFEGFTSYYDDLALVRSGVIGIDDYLELLGKTISNVMRGSGRLKQSVAESSFDAWTKYYRQDENAPNAIVSYYAKGALIALALDVQLRAGSEGRTSLDDVMRLLWQRHGLTGVGVPEDGIFAAVREVGGARLARWLAQTVEGRDDLPLARLLKGMGLTLEAAPASAAPVLGWKLGGGNGEAKVLNVHDGGPAQAAGVAAGDVLVALDGLKVSAAKALDDMLARRQAGDEVTLHVFRRDELMSFRLVLAEPVADKFTLKRSDRAGADALKLRKGWLGA